ncbi:MAG: DUF1552 domain-containing protein [Sandaracinus sp.]|nr:DUF1552 domain-containing protein [Sandaracinus sp.]MCB9616846.1 DUF1552 domain-containing protein [Sandaracinus sp.]MCB9625599.1 DUF1552 domain-containing protein [Sandaracinus sp.]MCB9634262.1 DUF1552 domain-containing protein [Sandaracinus sp.]
MKRRSFLRGALTGAAGLSLGLPWLESFGEAHAQPRTPRRFVVFMSPQGLMGRDWVPSSVGALNALPEVLQPLDAWRDRLLLVSGIDNAARQQFSVGGGDHNAAARTLFTATPYADIMNADGTLPSFAEQSARGYEGRTVVGLPWGPSVDQVVADHIGGATRLRSLHLRIGGADVGENELFFAGSPGAVSPVGGENRPDRVLAQLTSLRPSDGPAPVSTLASRLQARRGSVLDAVGGQLDSLATRVGAEDRQRLEAHATFVRDLERRIGSLPAPGFACAVPSFAPPAGYSAVGNWDHVSSPAMIDNAVMALSCDITRVVTVQFTEYNDPTFPFLDVDVPGRWAGWHEQIHVNQTEDRNARLGVFRFYAEQFARLLARLDSVSDGEGTLLDSTTVLWMSEFGEGANHNTSGVPVILAGATGSSMGRHVATPGRTTNDLFLTLARAFGHEMSSFGLVQANGTMLSRGPLTL